ncbi:MAG TPA: 30S ribosomal protein S8 [Thermoleophilia bacterium]|nr:30S ribosomal protein S8 [Thermoleophilia bacterium]HZK49164.1 30S ribosomal protein S8 [Thermoleophilia bacterium]
MSQSDPVADMLTRLRNANKALHSEVSMPTSHLKVEVARILKDEGYIAGYKVVKGESYDTLLVDLKYTEDRRRVITQLKRISKPGRRIYAKKDKLPKVLGGLGMAVVSTSRGVMSAREAQRLGVGGEVICFVW